MAAVWSAAGRVGPELTGTAGLRALVIMAHIMLIAVAQATGASSETSAFALVFLAEPRVASLSVLLPVWSAYEEGVIAPAITEGLKGGFHEAVFDAAVGGGIATQGCARGSLSTPHDVRQRAWVTEARATLAAAVM